MPPAQISAIAKGFRHLIEAKSGYIQLSMNNMDNTYVALPPAGNSMTMRFFAKDSDAEFNRLFIPLTEGSYTEWLDLCVSKLSRIFRYNS